MSICAVQDSGAIELYYYDELDRAERARVADHVGACAECAGALRELAIIRAALAIRPDVSAPQSGDWSSFMGRLDAAVRQNEIPAQVIPFAPPSRESIARRPFAGLVAMAALLALVTLGVFVASRAGRSVTGPAEEPSQVTAAEMVAGEIEAPFRAGLATVGMRHLERSKLVVLGLATKEVDAVRATDWNYERQLATGLLNDTRLYRITAEQRGLTSLANVMKDLELVLLQAAMAETTDRNALPQIQRFIQKRGLVQKMDVVGTTGLLP